MAEPASHAASRNEILLVMRQRTKAFSAKQGRRPRVLVTQFQTPVCGHEVEQVAALLADLGFDVDINPSMQQVDQVARMAMENDVHAIVVASAMSCENGLYLRRLADLLESADHDSILLAVCNRQGFSQKADVDGVLHLNALDEEGAQRLLEEIERVG
jgi:methylmalonyl-CoA mutase cobalamin-binding domain/chain